MVQTIIFVVSKTTSKETYLTIINEFHSGYIFKFDNTIDYATVLNRMNRYALDSKFKTIVCSYCSPGTELYSAYGSGTIVIVSVVDYVPTISEEHTIVDGIIDITLSSVDCGTSPGYYIYKNGTLMHVGSNYSFAVSSGDVVSAKVIPDIIYFEDSEIFIPNITIP